MKKILLVFLVLIQTGLVLPVFPAQPSEEQMEGRLSNYCTDSRFKRRRYANYCKKVWVKDKKAYCSYAADKPKYKLAFNELCEDVKVATPAKPSASEPEKKTPPAAAGDADRELWDLVKDSNDKDMIQMYLQTYPQGQYAVHARILLLKLKKSTNSQPPASQSPAPKTSPPTAEKGSIHISSEPSQASIYINDVFSGSSPLKIPVKPDIYTVEARKSGYNSESKRIRVFEGQNLDVTLILEKKGSSLFITSNPNGAEIYLDQVFSGQTPMQLNGLDKTRYQIKLSKQGYKTWQSIKHLKTGEPNSLSIDLVRIHRPKANQNKYPGKGITVRPARATWNTGYFQEALIRKALETLGYNVKPTKELYNSKFYKAVALGDVDYWANGWFPNHWSQTSNNFNEKAGIYGTVVKSGGLQGYLVSKRLAERYGIESLDDFKRPEVKKAFDTNGDGKAELVACPPGWGCESVISHHFKVYDLSNHISAIKASYSSAMLDALTRFNRGGPVFFYTWAPNWTLSKMKPGRDVVWINVPRIVPKKSQQAGRRLMTVSGVEGAVTDPVKLGFVVSDIRIVANNDFMRKNQPIKALFKVFSLPLADINDQNAKMVDGEKSEEDIKRHVNEWVADNKDIWNYWLDRARAVEN